MLASFNILSSEIYIYPMLMGMAWAIGINQVLSANEKYKINFPNIKLFILLLFVTSWVGAKLFFLITIDYKDVINLGAKQSFWLGGGFVFYGGFTFGLTAALLYKLVKKIDLSKFNMFVPSIALGHSIGRVGCFFAGCCHGHHIGHNPENMMYPVQLVEAFSLFLASRFFKRRINSDRLVIVEYIVFYAILRFVLEFFRGDTIRGIYWLSLSTSQYVSIGLIVIVLASLGVKKIKNS